MSYAEEKRIVAMALREMASVSIAYSESDQYDEDGGRIEDWLKRRADVIEEEADEGGDGVCALEELGCPHLRVTREGQASCALAEQAEVNRLRAEVERLQGQVDRLLTLIVDGPKGLASDGGQS